MTQTWPTTTTTVRDLDTVARIPWQRPAPDGHVTTTHLDLPRHCPGLEPLTDPALLTPDDLGCGDDPIAQVLHLAATGNTGLADAVNALTDGQRADLAQYQLPTQRGRAA